jgi:nucleoside 2-deoxyribosyltransferase
MSYLYLAGPISGLTYDEATAWRDRVCDYFIDSPVECLSPMRGKAHLVKYNKGGIPSASELIGNPLCSDKGIVTRDWFDVKRSDAVLMNLAGADRVSIGTMVEIGWISSEGIPLVIVLPSGSCHDHPFVRELAGVIVKDLSTGIDVVESILVP